MLIRGSPIRAGTTSAHKIQDSPNEIRRSDDNPVFYIDDSRDSQHEWSDHLADRIIWPATDVPSVCILDTGVNRAHALIEPALTEDDLQSYKDAWGVDDDHGHGTMMAGMSLHGDLTAPLADTEQRTLAHRLESVKIIPSTGHDPNEPRSYGAITQAAVALAETQSPDRPRTFCMAITNENVSGAYPSTWSAAIDQAVAGTMPGDEQNAPPRLFCIPIGNTIPEIEFTRWQDQDSYPGEDPAQAWNAITIGGYTDLNQVYDHGYEDWRPLAEVGDLSPHSRTSVDWLPARAPIKPELVLEAGNRALSPSSTEILSLDSLKLLTTGHEVDRQPLVTFDATSAATAQAARLCARLIANHPTLWPEMIRALLVHGAEYTDVMKMKLKNARTLTDRYPFLRQFGYGVPNFERSNASAADDLALEPDSKVHEMTQ